MAMARSAEKVGPTMRPHRGGMDEFYGLKEFRTGENPRWIYWRRSARTGALVAKEMTQVSPPRLMLLVDTFLVDRSRAMGIHPGDLPHRAATIGITGAFLPGSSRIERRRGKTGCWRDRSIRGPCFQSL